MRNDLEDVPTLTKLPSEILNIILEYLDVDDVLSARQTCSLLSKATFGRNLWAQLLHDQAKYVPMDDPIHGYTDLLESRTIAEVEDIVRKNKRNGELWTRARTRMPRRLKRLDVSGILIGLKVIAERWLLAVYNEWYFLLYDLGPAAAEDPTLYTRSAPMAGSNCTNFAIALDDQRTTLTIAISSSSMMKVYEIKLDFAESRIRLSLFLHAGVPGVVRALRIPERMFVFSDSTSVAVTTIKTNFVAKIATIRLNSENLEEWWDGIISVEMLGPYVLIFKARSLEIHEYESLLESSSAPVSPRSPLQHIFTVSLRDVSFSDCSVMTDHDAQLRVYQRSLFAHDVIQGLFHYTIRLTIPLSSESPLSLDVLLLGVYPLTLPLIPRPTSLNYRPSFNQSIGQLPDTNIVNSIADSPTPTYTHTHFLSPSFGVTGGGSSVRAHGVKHSHGHMANPAPRGFVSAHCMGPQGKRAIWVERQRSSTSRELIVWGQKPQSQSTILDGPEAVEIPKQVIFTIRSYDLRDDVSYCAFSEIYGTIALGHRSGDISILQMS
ncbi:hypothetical protein CPB83DRAFT_562575 [Crepidotus variabilis]|uniref:F-box domain-containing protein n=1 Tax=Crepidotus variabilis TaxID=179855 RepID=A0A9P6JLY5_9AGAR|nr:hypothetical protein CPB83DRAFT_562575 [Crepidotus variabilis]